MKALFYKGEDITLTFMSETDMSGYTKVVKFFTFGSSVKTATLTPVDNYVFKAKLSKADTSDLKAGRLNVVIEMTNASTNTEISKSIECRLADAYIDGEQRGDNSESSEIIFIQNNQINVHFTGSDFAVISAEYAASSLESKNAAEAANTAAQLAKTAAESANTSAQSAKTLAIEAYEAAEIAKTNAEVSAEIAVSITEPGKNMFDKDHIVSGFYVSTSDGSLGVNATSAVSNIIPVKGGDMYYLSGRNCTGYTQLRFLNASGVAMKPLNPDTGVELGNYSLPALSGRILAPATAVSVQFTIKFVGVGTFDAIQFEKGSVQTDYESYKNVIKQSALVNVVTTAELDAVSDTVNNTILELETSRNGLVKRINTDENTSVPGAFPAAAEAGAAFGITVSQDTGSPVKSYVGYKRTFLNTSVASGGSSFRTWTLPLDNQSRPSKISVAFWTKKTEFQNIFTTVFQSYMGLCVFNINPTSALSGTPVIGNGNAASSTELSSAKMEFAVIAETGDYIRIRLAYHDLVWKGTFTGSSILYYFLFNGANSQNKPFSFIDFTVLFNVQEEGSTVYPDNGTIIGSETIKSAYDVSIQNTGRIKTLEEALNSVVSIKRSGNFIYIISPWNATHNLVKVIEVVRSSLYTSNPVANFISEYLALKSGDPTVSAISIKDSTDDITPANLNGSFIGANHSWNQGYNVQMTGHGKTLADIGSVYRNASNVEFVILRIVDANNLWMISKNQAVDGFTYTFVQPSGTLTYYSNGANTGNIVVATSTGLGNTYTSVAASAVKILIDGKIELTSDGTYFGKFVDIVESYDVLDLPSILNQLIANRPVGGYLSAPQLNSLAGTEKLFNHSINYRFTRNGNTVVSTTFRNYKKLVINFHGFIQSTALTSGNIYCPKSLPISDGTTTFDFRQVTGWTTPPAAALNLTPSYWENPLSPPDRVLNMNATVNLMLGYITDRGIETSRKDVVYNSMFLNTTRKLYPMGINNQTPVAIDPNTFYSCVAYRSYTNPANNPAGRTNYSFVEAGSDVYIFIDYHGALNDSIIPEPEWIGKKITVYEKNSQCTLIGDVVTGSIEVLSTASPTNYGFIVLKLS